MNFFSNAENDPFSEGNSDLILQADLALISASVIFTIFIVWWKSKSLASTTKDIESDGESSELQHGASGTDAETEQALGDESDLENGSRAPGRANYGTY